MNNNYGLVYPSEGDYYDVNVTNSNFSKIADNIDKIKSGGLKREIVVASYDTANPYKDAADFVCNESNGSDILKSAVESCCEGGMILLLDGSYYLDSTVEVNKSITICGYGSATKIIQGNSFTGYALLKLKKANITIREVSMADSVTGNRAIHLICVDALSASIGNCEFSMNRANEENDVAPVYFEIYYSRVLMINCYIRKHNDKKSTINATKTQLYGVVMGNYCQDMDNDSELSVRINVINTGSAQRIKHGAQNTELLVMGGVYNG